MRLCVDRIISLLAHHWLPRVTRLLLDKTPQGRVV
jgi:hypothetical protein